MGIANTLSSPPLDWAALNADLDLTTWQIGHTFSLTSMSFKSGLIKMASGAELYALSNLDVSELLAASFAQDRARVQILSSTSTGAGIPTINGGSLKMQTTVSPNGQMTINQGCQLILQVKSPLCPFSALIRLLHARRP